MTKVNYYHSLCVSLKNNTKKLWKIINRTIGKESNKSCILEKLKVGNIVYDSPKDISNELASYFSNVGSTYAKSIKPSSTKVLEYLKKIKRNDKSIFLTATTQYEISKLIRSLPNKNSSGYDLINNKLLKAIKDEVSKPLEIIYNHSMKTGTFPEKMKLAEVVPLHKGKSCLDAGNYRPISLLITLSKILEKILYVRTYKFLNDNNQI